MIPAPNRRDFLKTMATAAAGAQFFGLVSRQAQAAQLASQKNLLIILTDQERPPMWFPTGWEAVNLPNTMRLRANGLTFNRSFCATAMCTPSRIAMWTGLYPAQHHSPWTLTEDFQQTPTEPQLNPALPNLATCLKEAGYDVIYKGKWHGSHGVTTVDGEYVDDDISRYGFDEWDAPDAGGDTRIENFGGGTANNDQRFIDDAKVFLENRLANPTGKPFCLIVSLVNPHDVLAYPGLPPGSTEQPAYIAGGYDDSWTNPTTPPISLPPTVDENLATNYKPTAHAAIKAVIAGGLGPVVNPAEKLRYLNFYGNLMKHVDSQIGELLAVLDAAGPSAVNDMLIVRTSDHGENGMCHGSLRQKTFVTYEETIRVPLIWSNPELFPTPLSTDALVSHVDLLPTLCALTGVPDWQSKGFAGVDYSSIILNPLTALPVQNYVLFDYQDIYAASDAASFPNGAVPPPNCIQMIRTADYKYARYYDSAGVAQDQQEFYDLRPEGGDYDTDHALPLELKNLSIWAEALRVIHEEEPIATPGQAAARTVLMNQLADLGTTRLAPRAYSPAQAPKEMKFEVKRWTDPDLGPQAKVQLTFYSQLKTSYQLQKSTDLIAWSNLGAAVPGNNSLILMSDTMDDPNAFYRIVWDAA